MNPHHDPPRETREPTGPPPKPIDSKQSVTPPKQNECCYIGGFFLLENLVYFLASKGLVEGDSVNGWFFTDKGEFLLNNLLKEV